MYMSVLDIDEIIERENEKYSDTDTVFPAEEGLGSLSGEEFKLINLRLGAIAENEVVFGILWSVRDAIYEVVRAVKDSIGSNECVFAGEYAEGRELNLDIITPQDVKKTGTPLSDWLQSVSAGDVYFESDSGDSKITLPEYEGRVYAGWVDTIDSPLLVKVMYDLPKLKIIVNTPFELCKEYPAIRHKAVKLKPKDAYAIKVRYKASGDDEARPIAVKITTAEKFESGF